MNDQHGPGTRCEHRAQRGEIDLPTVVVKQRIGDQPDVGEIGEKFKQWIAGRGNENLVTRFTQQMKNVAVPFTRSRREYDAFRIDAFSRPSKPQTPAVVINNGRPRLAEPLTLRTVLERAPVGERRDDFLLRIRETASRGI